LLFFLQDPITVFWYYGSDGIVSYKSQPVLLEYRCPGGKATKRSQSSLNAFISEENQTDPENITHYELMLCSSYMKFEKDKLKK
jgi:hypothetical protein